MNEKKKPIPNIFERIRSNSTRDKEENKKRRTIIECNTKQLDLNSIFVNENDEESSENCSARMTTGKLF